MTISVLIADDQALVAIEEAEPLCHVTQGDLEADILRGDQRVAFLELQRGLCQGPQGVRPFHGKARIGGDHGGQ